ncbi:MAG: FHA domain-containing protein, partial [Bacillota bacterium]|nr:FHA domain-containing protein [Bacillota bacterium]
RKLFDKKSMVATSQSNSYGNNNVDNKGAFQNKSIKSIQTPSNINNASDYNNANKNFKGFNDTSKNSSSNDSSTSDRNILDKSFQRADQSGIMGTELLNDNSKADTVLLQDSSNLPYLLNLNSGSNEKIFIDKASFVIGRLKSQVDYELRGSGISKVHSEIITRNGQYFIKDLNSSNGTYVNSEKIKSNFEFEIKNHDIIRFANMEFQFLKI